MRIKHLIISTILLTSAFTVSSRETIDLNFGWKFKSDIDSQSVTVNLPHDYLIGQPWLEPSSEEKPDNKDGAANFKSRLSARAFKEPVSGTYTLKFRPGKELKGKRIMLDFEGIMLRGDVYLNSKKIGGTDYGYLGFDVDVSQALKYGEDNIIVVKAETGKPENSRWYTGGGLYRPVKMIVTDPELFFTRHGLWISTPNVSENKADVVVNFETRSKTKDKYFIADVVLKDNNGNTVASRTDTIPVNRKWRQREYTLQPFTIDKPNLWSTESPSLYSANISIRRNGSASASDSLAVNFGIRSVEFSPEYGMKLNGKKVLLKGIANHHTLGALGAAAYPAAIEKRLKLLKKFGFNHIRTSHNPYSEEFLNICDRLGILVVDELYDKWLTQYSGGRREWSAQWQDDIPEWIKRDRNHPSVIMWSLGNELQGYSNLPFNDWGVTAYKLQKTLLERYDTTRMVTVAMHPRYRSLETDSLPAPLVLETDIASYNYRYMYFPGDSRRFPWLIFYQSEASKSAMGPNFFEPDNNRVTGLAYWGMIDYLGESAGWPAKGWAQGVFDISLQPKPEAWFVKSMFTDSPVVHIGIMDKNGDSYIWNDEKMNRASMVDHWNFNKNENLDISVFSNAEEVDLQLNGKSLGRKRNTMDDPASRNRFVWENIAYVPGKIEAIGYVDGKEIAKHHIQTTGKAVRLVAEPDNDNWKADGYDLQHIIIRAVDTKGRTVPLDGIEVDFKLEGDASIIGLDNGDIYSDELHVPDSKTNGKRSLHHGTALVILRAGKTPGNITLSANAHGLKSYKSKMNTL